MNTGVNSKGERRANFAILDITEMSNYKIYFAFINNMNTKTPIQRTEIRKIVIKCASAKPTLPENYFEKTYKKLQEAVIAIQQSKPIKNSLEELYHAVENMCLFRKGSQVYITLRDLFEAHVKRNVDSFTSGSMNELVFLKEINGWWLSYCKQIEDMRHIFLFVDRTYVLKNANVQSIWDMGLDLFRTHIVLNGLVLKRTVEGLLMLLDKERNGDAVDRALLKSLVRMLCDLHIYVRVFEDKFIIATKQMYQGKVQCKIQELDVPEYLQHTDMRLTEENERILRNLYSSCNSTVKRTLRGTFY